MSELLNSLRSRPRPSRTLTFPYDQNAEDLQIAQARAVAERTAAALAIQSGDKETGAMHSARADEIEENEIGPMAAAMEMIEVRVGAMDRIKYDGLLTDHPATDEQNEAVGGDPLPYNMETFPKAIALEVVLSIRHLSAEGEDGKRESIAASMSPSDEEILALWETLSETDRDRVLGTAGDLMMNATALVAAVGKG